MNKWFKFLCISILLIGLFSTSYATEKQMIVRVYVDNYQELSRHIRFKGTNIEIAGAEPGKWYELIVTPEDYPIVLGSGLSSEIIIEDLSKTKEQALTDGQYHSYDEINQILRDMATNYPSICKLDSLGLTYENRQIYGVKISDNPEYDDPNEPDVLFVGCHHAREWASIEVCRHIADSLTRAYATVPEIQSLVDNHEIWIFPIINVDGFVYDYPAQRSWRKNRQPFSSAIGTDPNRNYNGCCNGDELGDWGAIPDGGQVTHYPSQITFMGPFGYSGYEIKHMTDFFKNHEFNAILSFHLYSELVLWSWSYTDNTAPDNAIIVRVGQRIASLMQRLGSGNYTPQQGIELYPAAGGSDDWMYGYSHWLSGTPCISYTIELGTTFYQPAAQLDNLQFQAFKAAYCIANFSDSVRILMKSVVPPPMIATMDTSQTGDFTIIWSAIRAHGNQPEMWEVEELSDYSVIEDDLESTTEYWTLAGFTLSTAQSHSASNSFFSGSADNISNYARTTYPYLPQPGDSLTFWCWFDLENNYDVAVAEVSLNLKEWIQLDDRYTGNSSGWIRKAYSLEPWIGKSIYIRFRCMTDDRVLRTGFYVDDIYPVPYFNQTQVLSSTIIDTFYNITGQQVGQYWYRVKGYNTDWSWGDYSTLEDIIVTGTAISEECCPLENESGKINIVSLKPNPFFNRITITYNTPAQAKVSLQIYDAMGKLVTIQQLTATSHRFVWDGRDEKGKYVPAGVYWFKLTNENSSIIKRGILLR